jgi:CheY-like chemotaxis protein
MKTGEVPGNVEARHQLEDTWRFRLEESLRAYRAASAEYRTLLQKEAEGHVPSTDSPLARARRAESEALMEYSRVLQIFTSLTLDGKMPQQKDAPEEPRRPEGPSIISVVDDDESIRDSTRTLLRSAGYQVATFESAERFLDSGALARTECIVLDVRMPGMDGLELQRRLKASQASVPIIFLTAHDDARNRRLALDGGAMDFLCKPFEAGALVTAVQAALTRRQVDLRER